MEKWLSSLCDRIKMPDTVSAEVCKIYREQTCHKEDSPDPYGYLSLTRTLADSCDSYQHYQEKGIPDDIFYSTFACFSRFVKEYKASYGVYGFDRDWWTTRQLSLHLFRLGELEYEMVTKVDKNFQPDEKPVISIHIPSDGKITRENCRRSYLYSLEFFQKYYPEYPISDYVCESWLLAPALKEILPETSNIIQFQESFTIDKIDPEADDYMEWVFKNPKIELEQVPQDTSLQRKIKAYLQEGNFIGTAEGRLKKDAFL